MASLLVSDYSLLNTVGPVLSPTFFWPEEEWPPLSLLEVPCPWQDQEKEGCLLSTLSRGLMAGYSSSGKARQSVRALSSAPEPGSSPDDQLGGVMTT